MSDGKERSLVCLKLSFSFHAAALSRSFSFHSIYFILLICSLAGIGLKRGIFSQPAMAAMQGLQLSYPPAQFNFQIAYGADSVVPIERLFRFFALESLVLDPVRTLFPLQVPRDLEVDVTPSQWRKFKPDWESAFNEDYEYIVFLPEGLYAQVYTHMARAFPDHIVQCHGDGRVAKVDVRVKPMAYSDLADALFQMQSEIDPLHAEVAKMWRCQELMFHNLATLTKEWMEVNPELAERLHPSTPQSWLAPRSEEY